MPFPDIHKRGAEGRGDRREHQSEATDIPPRSALTRPLETASSDLMGTGGERIFYDPRPARDRRRMSRLMSRTAWKHERIEELVYKALKARFRAFHMAAQPCNYDEAGVGRAICRAVGEGIMRREDVVFTPAKYQDPRRMP
ncbi:hypothetical protein DL771_012194 [Monosporascus sp. 5C6A]|nr:hypothetical protein DL771_012194 [Monosporascus sp. 5C6A]